VRADRDQADGPGGADLAGDRGAELPDGLAGVDELREEPAGKPSLSMSAVFQSPPTMLSRPVVDALVRSARLVPVSQ
jgi:hypothetical protein